MGDIQKFIENHPGCSSSDIANAFSDYPRRCVLQSASKLRQSGRVAHCCEGDTHRHFSLLAEMPHEPDLKPVWENRSARNAYVGTNNPQVISGLTRQAEELESRGLFRRAATVWTQAFDESLLVGEREVFSRRRQKCIERCRKSVRPGEQIYLAGRFVGDVE